MRKEKAINFFFNKVLFCESETIRFRPRGTSPWSFFGYFNFASKSARRRITFPPVYPAHIKKDKFMWIFTSDFEILKVYSVTSAVLIFLSFRQHCPARNLRVSAFVIPECFYRVSRSSFILDSR